MMLAFVMADGREQSRPNRKGGSMAASSNAISYGVEARSIPKGIIVLLGRVSFSLVFIFFGAGHFAKQTVAYAAAQGVPLASITVPLSGLLALGGGLSILLGYRVKIGTWLIALFLAAVTPVMHKFWGLSDPMMAQMQMAMFMKNVSMLGGALLISQFGAGPLSLDARRLR
jgi:putative oxidoreductase